MAPRDPDTSPPPAERPRNRVAALVAELARLARTDPDALARRIAALDLREQAELALRLPAAQRLELLLHAPQPERLVRALPDFEVFLAAREVGPSEAQPLLALASAAQLQHVVDLEAWRKDRFDADRTGGWLALMLEAGVPVAQRFLRTADEELLALLLQRWVRVEQIQSEDTPDRGGHGEGEEGSERGYLTPDGEHRFSPSIPEHLPAIRRLLQLLFSAQPERYERVLWSALWELGSELEEQALHWRQSRLEEHGFPRWEEALEIYAPPARVDARPAPRESDTDAMLVPRSPLRSERGSATLAAAIDALSDELRERVLHETVSLANHVLVADAGDTGDPAAHRFALELASGYVELALRLRGAADPAAAADALAQRPVLELFREGYARAAALQVRARQLVQRLGAERAPEALAQLDPLPRARLAALLERRPLALTLDGDPPTPRTHPFRTPHELAESERALELATRLGGFGGTP